MINELGKEANLSLSQSNANVLFADVSTLRRDKTRRVRYRDGGGSGRSRTNSASTSAMMDTASSSHRRHRPRGTNVFCHIETVSLCPRERMGNANDSRGASYKQGGEVRKTCPDVHVITDEPDRVNAPSISVAVTTKSMRRPSWVYALLFLPPSSILTRPSRWRPFHSSCRPSQG